MPAELVADRERVAPDVDARTPSMNDARPAEQPIAIERVERSQTDGDGLALTISGRCPGHRTIGERLALLVVERDGRRHRFPAQPDGGDELRADAWTVTFLVPDWAEPGADRPATLWLGDVALRVPAVGKPSPGPGRSGARGLALLIPTRPDRPPDEPPAEPETEPGRTGPLADMLFRETVTALRGELEQRSADAARLRAALAAARSELEVREGAQAGLEATHGELRGEFDQLIEAVERYRQDFDRRLEDAEGSRARTELALEAERERARAAEAEAEQLRSRLGGEAGVREQLVAATVARDAALAEVGGLRSELERLGTELAVAGEQAAAQGADLGEAERLLADARALTEQLRVEISQ